MPKGGKLKIQTKTVALNTTEARQRPGVPANQYVVLSVSDTGCGMDAATKARIFEPFFTTKESGKGTGLGLATVYGIVKQSGGFIWLNTEVGKGTCFEIYFPRVDEKLSTVEAQPVTRQKTNSGTTLLLVEDEPTVRELASAFLISAGYKVVTAQNGVEAVSIAQKMGNAIHGLVTDVVMPQMRGPELAERVLEFLPETRVVFMSGYPQHSEANPDLDAEKFFVQKPFTRESLVLTVGQAMTSQTGPTSRKPAPATRELKRVTALE